MNHSETMLSAHRLRKAFGGVLAVNDVSFDVRRNQITGIIGPNGAGKTTILNLITGIYPLTSGNILFEEKRISGFKPFQIASHGITRTFQNLQVFQNMTVLENVMVGLHTQTRPNSAAVFSICQRWEKKKKRSGRRATISSVSSTSKKRQTG